ncbi:hypothetical protein Aduo_003119 [Ancylostoma duodenale]
MHSVPSEDSNDSQASNDSEASLCSPGKITEDDWCLVDDAPSGRSSPELVPNPELRDIDQLSFASKKSAPAPTAEEIRRSEELRQAKAATAHRLQLERVLFEDVDSPNGSLTLTSLKAKNSLVSAAKLKRATAVTHVSSESKTKTRSKKAGKMSSGRNNDRKVADELSVPKGTKVKAIYREDDWIYVHASGGKRGFVPQAYCRLNVESPDIIQHKLNKTTARVQRRSSRKEQEKPSRTTTSRYLHKDIHKSSLERFLDSLPVKKDEGQPFHTKDLGKARAQYRYDASRADEVNVYEGEEVIVLNTDDPEWTYVRNKKHHEGFVPANHLDTFRQNAAQSASNTESEHRLVIEDFDGRHALDISVEQGEWVIVISNDPEGWMWVRRLRDGKEGFLPSTMAVLATNL